MRKLALLALFALIPAGLGTSPAAAASLSVSLCTGDGHAHAVSLPLRRGALPGRDDQGCCAKGCHGGSRKKSRDCATACDD